MKWLVPALLMFSVPAFAETTTYDVSGMTCGSCVKAIKAKVCKTEGLEKCEVSIGKVVVSTKAGVATDNDKIKSAIEGSGDYKITGSKTSK